MTPPEWACGQCGHMHDADRACLSVLRGHGRTCNCDQRAVGDQLAATSVAAVVVERLSVTHTTHGRLTVLAAALAAARADGDRLRERIEALIAFYDRHEYSSVSVDDLRALLDGER